MKFRVGFETRFQMVPLWFFFFRKFSISFLGLEFSLPVLPPSLPVVIFLTTLILVQANCTVVYDLCSRLPYLWKLNGRLLKVMMHDRIRQFFHYLFNGSEKLRRKSFCIGRITYGMTCFLVKSLKPFLKPWFYQNL